MSDLTPAMVRDYLQVTDTSGQWSDGLIGSNITAARGALQRMTGRQIESQGSNTAVIKTFSTHGRSWVTLPGLVSGTATLSGTDLISGETVHFIPDRMDNSVYIAVQLPSRRSFADYRSHPDWFDRNYDNWLHRGRLWDIPNDLLISGQWGFPVVPTEVLFAWKVLAAYYTKRPESVLGGAALTPSGTEIDMSLLPREVQDFVRDWKLRDYY